MTYQARVKYRVSGAMFSRDLAKGILCFCLPLISNSLWYVRGQQQQANVRGEETCMSRETVHYYIKLLILLSRVKSKDLPVVWRPSRRICCLCLGVKVLFLVILLPCSCRIACRYVVLSSTYKTTRMISHSYLVYLWCCLLYTSPSPRD